MSKDLNCTLQFFPDECIFQDLHSARRIGSARREGGLYFFDEPVAKHEPDQGAMFHLLRMSQKLGCYTIV